MRKPLNTKEVAELIGVSERWVEADRYTHKLLPFYRIGKAIRYDLEDIEAFLRANREGGNGSATNS